MGEYGAYIWSSFAMAAFIILAMTIVNIRALRRAQKTLRQLENEA